MSSPVCQIQRADRAFPKQVAKPCQQAGHLTPVPAIAYTGSIDHLIRTCLIKEFGDTRLL